MTGFDNNVATKFPKLESKTPTGFDLLQAERAKASFNVGTVSKFIFGEDYLARLNKTVPVLESEPAFEKTQRYFQSRYERHTHDYEKDNRMIELTEELKWDAEDKRIVNMLYDQVSPFSLHYLMFIPTLENQCTDEQKKKLFLERALRCEIIGCYAQTELGHGSNVQGVETTATYIPETNEFELHSPYLSSSKWWIGTLGKTANYAAVMARLIIHGKDYGPHPFCVQVCSLEDQRPLPGVTVGDIGPKFGYVTIDNGFLMFDHYRVPHISFLAKFSQVIPGTGEYVKQANARLSYGTMVLSRANIVRSSGIVMARGATVAVRYSAVRQQFVDASGPRKWENKVIETPVLDYTMQQYRLFTTVASAYALLISGRNLHRLYALNQTAMKEGNLDLLPDLHATSCGLKSLVATITIEGLEDSRRACGGHGFSLFSGLGYAYQDYLPLVTFEGDNYLLTQQTARYLFKTFRSVAAGKAKPNEHNVTINYLNQYLENSKAAFPVSIAAELLNPETLMSAFGFRAAYGIAQVVEELDKKGRTWNSVLVNINRVSKAHCQYALVRDFFVELQQASEKDLGPSERKVMQNLAYLFALAIMEKEMTEFLTCGYVFAAQTKMVQEQIFALLEQIRPDAVSLVDAFALPDYYLASALGRYDGDYFTGMTQMVEKEPLNQKLVIDSYEKYIKPLVHKGLQKAKNESKL